MYQVGDLIIYGSTGVCTVTEIRTVESRWSDDEQLYYVLAPLYQDCVILAPVDNLKPGTRPTISPSEANRLIDSIPSITPQVFHSDRTQDVIKYYKSYIDTHDCAELLELTVSLRAKKSSAGGSKTKFGTVDQRFMTQAEELLFGELAVVLGVSRSDVQGYVESRLNGDGDAALDTPSDRTLKP